jgi:hypothetical protein
MSQPEKLKIDYHSGYKTSHTIGGLHVAFASCRFCHRALAADAVPRLSCKRMH